MSFDECGTSKRRLGGRCLGAGWCPVAPLSGLVVAGRSGRRCQLLLVFFHPFENPWRLLAECWNAEKFLAQLLLGWNYGAWGHICCDPLMRVSPDATHKQLLRLMMLTIAGNPLGMEY